MSVSETRILKLEKAAFCRDIGRVVPEEPKFVNFYWNENNISFRTKSSENCKLFVESCFLNKSGSDIKTFYFLILHTHTRTHAHFYFNFFLLSLFYPVSINSINRDQYEQTLNLSHRARIEPVTQVFRRFQTTCTLNIVLIINKLYTYSTLFSYYNEIIQCHNLSFSRRRKEVAFWVVPCN